MLYSKRKIPHQPKIDIADSGGIVMLFVCYPKCTTCQKAQAFLNASSIPYDVRDIKAENPSETELRAWHAKSGLPLQRFFNTSGLQYKALGLARRRPAMTEDEQFSLLATDGMLVKRPILVGERFVLVGFKQAEWESMLY
jgi:arsenate reductase